MPDPQFHLAEFNVSRLLAPLDSPQLREFVAFLGPVNAFAEQSPGFVWRLTAPDGQSSSYLPSPFTDPMMITNLTVWTDIDALRAFTFQTVHKYFLQSRRSWFERLASRGLVLWWLPTGHEPTLDEAMAKLNFLEEFGPTNEAFTFQDAFDPAGNPLPRPTRPGQSDAP